MLSQSLLQFRAVILHPAPDRGVIDIETALFQQLLNIAQRKRIAKIPSDHTKYEAGFGLPPLEDRGSGYHSPILSRNQPATLKVATHPTVPYLEPEELRALLFPTESGRHMNPLLILLLCRGVYAKIGPDPWNPLAFAPSKHDLKKLKCTDVE